MGLFNETERRWAEALAGLSYCNPFLPERIEFERAILEDDFIDSGVAWHKPADETEDRPNIELLTRRCRDLAGRARSQLLAGTVCNASDRVLYEDVVLYYLFNKYEHHFFDYIVRAHSSNTPSPPPIGFYRQFRKDIDHYFTIPTLTFQTPDEADHLFACFLQIRRAFHHIYDNIIGGSMASARLRAAVWQSIFTCDMRRYRRVLYERMGEITTLITGPSGTGKELVARAIGLSRYIPFDSQTGRPVEGFTMSLHPVNLSALSPTLIESELFGHVKGAFTGAVNDHAGLFERCSPYGTVFLDEIGDLDPSIQVKLLRVLQTREFQRIGDSTEQRFHGKSVAATNRDPANEMREGRFREDLYYRLCSDVIVTPSLRDQIKGSPEQLQNLLLFISRRVAGEREAETMAQETYRWIDETLGLDYAWPGNVRELEQCVRNFMIRRTYQPSQTSKGTARDAFVDAVRDCRVSADELLRHYCTLVYLETGSYQQAAGRLNLDRRTVKNHVDNDLLDRYRSDR